MRDVHRCGAEAFLQPGDLGARLNTKLGVEIGQRLIHQEGLGRTNDGAPHRHTLTLTAGQVGRLAVEVLGQIQNLRCVLDLLVDLAFGQLRERQREGDVLPHRHVGVERIGLEHHRDVAVLGCAFVDAFAGDAQFTGRDVLQTGNHVEGRGLSASGRSDEDDELAVGDGDVHFAHRGCAVGEELGDFVENDFGHDGYPFTAPDVKPATMRR